MPSPFTLRRLIAALKRAHPGWSEARCLHRATAELRQLTREAQ